MEQWQVVESLFAKHSEVKEQLQSHPWSKSSLGAVSVWPPSLKTALGILFNADCPMLCIWGSDRVLFYNDAFAAGGLQNQVELTIGQPLVAGDATPWHSLLVMVERVFSTGQPLKLVGSQTGCLALNMEWSYSPIWDESDAVGGVFVSGHSSRSAAAGPAANLFPTALRLENLANSLSILLAYIDRDQRYRFVNQSSTPWFGVEPEDMIGKHVEAVIGEAAYQAIKPDIDIVLAGHKLNAERTVCFTTLGWRQVQHSFVPDFDENGQVRGYYALINDVTDCRRSEDSLYQREAELQLITDAIPALIAQVDNQQRYRFNNQTYETWFGRSPAALQGQHIRDLIGESAYEQIRPYVERALTGETVRFEQEVAFQVGGIRHIEATYVPQFAAQGGIDGFVALIADVSDRKRHETERQQAEIDRALALAALQESEARFHRIADHSPIMIWMSDAYGAGIWFNQRWFDFTGQAIADALGDGWLTAVHPDDAAKIYETCLTAHRNRETVNLEYRLRHHSGEYRWVLDNAIPRFDENGEYLGYIGSVIDIHDRKQAEAERECLLLELTAERAQFEAVLRQMPEGVMIADAASDSLVMANAQTSRILRYDYDFGDRLGSYKPQEPFEVYRPNGEPYTADEYPLARSLHRGEVVIQEEMELIFDNGDHVIIDVNSSPVFNQQGRITSAVAVFQDVTHRHRAEAELRQREEQARLAIQVGRLGTWRYDLQTDQVVLDERMQEIWGEVGKDSRISLTQLITRIHPDDRDRIRNAVAAALAPQSSGTYEADYRIVWEDGSVRWISANGQTQFAGIEAGRHAVGFFGTALDITDRKRPEQALQAAEERLRLAVEGAQMATWDIDLLTGRAIWSELHFRMLGYDPTPDSEASEAMWDTCIHPDDRDWVYAEWQQARSEHRLYRAEYRIIRADTGEVAWLEGLGSFLYDDQDRAVRSIGVLFDISDRKRGEAQRQQAEAALQKQRTILEAILRQAADAIIVVDAQGQLVFVNRAAKRLAQVDPESAALDLNLLSWGTAYDAEGRAIPLENYCINKALRGESISAFEARMVREDGSYYDILISAAPLWNDRGGIIGAVGTFVDISDRKRAEEALRESEARFRYLADGTPMLVWMSGPDKQCSYCNQSWLDFTGRALEQELGNGWAEGIHPDDRDQSMSTYFTAFDQHRDFEMEYRLRRHDGEYRWVLDVGVPRFTPEGEFLGYIGSCVDIHDRKQVEAALQESEERFRNLADNISQFAWMTDETGWIFWYNQRWFDYTGTTLEQMAGWGWRSVHHPDHVDRVVAHFSRSLETGEPWEDIFPLRGKDGDYRWFLSRALPIRDETGKIVRWFGTNTDITERKHAEESLAQREAELRLVTNAVPALISFVDAEQRYRFNNHRYEEWFGQPAESTYGRHLREVLGEAAYENIRPYVEQVLAGQEVTYESQLPYRVGGPRYISATYVPRFTSEGGVAGFVALVSDISDRKRDEAQRKQAEAALRQSEERLRMAQQAAGAGLWDWDMVNDRVTWSEEHYKLYGLETTVTPSYDLWIACIAPEDRERANQAVHEAMEHRQNLNVEFRIHHPEKGLQWIAAIGQTFCDEHSNPIRMTGIALNITEQKRFEQALITSEALAKSKAEELVAIMESTPAAIWLAHDPDCHNITGNQTAYELMRMPPGSVSTATAADGTNPLPFRQCKSGQDIPPHDLPMQKAARLGQDVTDDLEFVFEDGTVSYIYGKAVPLFGPNHEVRGVIGGFVDITALKQSEQERERLLQRERQAREEAENASRIKDEFLAILSHELRSPLNPILGWSTLLRQGRLDAERTAIAIETIERNAKLQIQLIDDLLDVSRIIRGKLRLKIAPTDLKNVVNAAIETVRLAAEAKEIAIETHFEGTIGKVMGDGARLQQVVWNLLSNAVKFTPEGGRVTVAVSMMQEQARSLDAAATPVKGTVDYVRIQVSDTGKGIPASFIPHVFEYFRQADSTTTRSFGGLGLGLAIVRYLVEMHGGTVHASSRGENQGATFTVRLPVAPQMPAAVMPEPALPLAGDVAQLRSLRLLVVDDDADTREFIAFALEAQGADVAAVASAKAALRSLEDSTFDLLISDIGMPDMDGYMLIQQIRALPTRQRAEMPAIALTAYAAEGDRDRVLAAGFQQHIPKPVELERLVAAILQLVRP